MKFSLTIGILDAASFSEAKPRQVVYDLIVADARVVADQSDTNADQSSLALIDTAAISGAS